MTDACCMPAREPSARRTVATPVVVAAGSTAEMVPLPGGTFVMGSDDDLGYPADGEGPVREVTIDPFWIDRTATSNAAFARFVEATGYTTDAERYGWSFVFAGLLPDDFPPTRAVADAPWWRQVEGADWRHPEGLRSTMDDRLDHPAIHLSWHDATAYAAWTSKRLPTEAEWEYAARGGLEQRRYPWGDQLLVDGEHRCNIWQGTFPDRNDQDDGYVGTAPIDAFPANGFGLYNTVGNVWEWCGDWFHPTFHKRGTRANPTGPPFGDRKVTRGGSYLCHESYCFRYRVPARSGSPPDSSTGNLGFRCVMPA